MLADNDDTIITEEELQKYLSASLPSIKYKVYFDSITGAIVAITNEDHNSNTSYVEFNEIEVIDFLSGKKDFTKCKIGYNNSSSPQIVEPTQDISIDDTLFKISACVDVADVNIENYVAEKKWGIKISDNERDAIKKHQINSKIDFYITLRQNPALLIRTLTIDVLELANNRRVFFSHVSEIESMPHKVCLYTKKFFNNYSLELR